MMKALVYNGTPTPVIEERPIPQIAKPTDAVVKMSKGSICGTLCPPISFDAY